jgi:hypothetical protein
MFGTAPLAIAMLAPEERSCISPARNMAHIFSCFGGCDKCVQGWHSAMEVEMDNVHQTLQGVDHELLLRFPGAAALPQRLAVQ